MPRILIISGDVVDYYMGGVGVRYWCLANTLSDHFDVILAIPNQTKLTTDKFRLVSFDLQHDNIQHLTSDVDVIVTHGFVLHFHPYLSALSIPFAIDLYVPYLLESLVWHDQDNWSEWIPAYEEYLRVQLEVLRVGDFFFCASERQRDYWLGWLHAQKRINPHTFRDDPTLRTLINLVPFGLPEEVIKPTKAVLKGVHPNISLDDKLILWSGGLWDWLDPITLIKAVHSLVPRFPDLKLYFMGTYHPNADVKDMEMPAIAIDLCRKLGLLDVNVFFGDWISYLERENYLAEADLAVISHPNHIETHFSFRTRVLDAIWAEIPIIITEGDDFASEVVEHQIGIVIPEQDVDAMAAAIELTLYKDRSFVSPDNFAGLKASLRWSQVVSPLRDFCAHPRKMVDKGQYLTELERIVRDKESYFERVLQERESNYQQRIQAQENEFSEKLTQQEIESKALVVKMESEMAQLVHANELRVEETIRAKDEKIRQIIETKDQELAQELSKKDDAFSLVLQEKNHEIEKRSRQLVYYQDLIPFVSVIVVNYNGKHYLRDCLNALQLQTYPSHRFETIISDNGSSDGSLQLLQEEFPGVKLISNQENLGFATGNNIGIKSANGDFIILLNNDTVVDPGWLDAFVKVAIDHPDAGLVTGHLQLFYEQLELEIDSETFIPENDNRSLGIQVFDIDTGLHKGVVQYLEGFYGWENVTDEIRFRWTKGKARIGIPIPVTPGDWTFSLRLAATRPTPQPVPVRIRFHDQLLDELTLTVGQPENYDVILTQSVRENATPLVQNVGSIIFKNGSGRDKGTYVRDFEVFYEVDRGQYDRADEVFAGCGASLLLRRSMINDVGLMDDDFFMYYEDTDLSWRARLKGWNIIHAPGAVVKHIHCGSSGEWSPFFIYHVERNRLAMVFKNGTWHQIIRTWASFLYNLAKDTFVHLLYIGKGYLSPNLKLRYKVLFRLASWMPALIKKRWVIQHSRRVNSKELDPWFIRE